MTHEIPNYQTCMLPLLKLASKKYKLKEQDAVEILSNEFCLSEKARSERLQSGQRVIANRINWAKTYLKKVGLLSAPKRGLIKITDEGQKVLSSKSNWKVW